MQAAERHSYILALHGRRYALSETGLAHSRRPVQADDRRLQVAPKLQHGQVLEYALLGLLHAVVVMVEDFLRSLQLEVVLGIFAPWQLHHLLQIVQLNAVLRTLRIEHVESVEFLVEHLSHLLRPVLLLSLFHEAFLLRRAVTAAELLLDVLYLLLQEILFLLLVQVLSCLVPDAVSDVKERYLLVERAQRGVYSLLKRVLLEHAHFFLHAERHVGADEVHEHHIIADVLQCEARLVGHVLVLLYVFGGCLMEILHQRLELPRFGIGEHIHNRSRNALQEWLSLRKAVELAFAKPLQDDSHLSTLARHLHYPDNSCVYARVVQVAVCRVFNVALFLAEDTNDDTWVLLHLLDDFHAAFPAYQQRSDNTREHHHVAGGQHGYLALHLSVDKVAYVAFKIGYHLYGSVLFLAHFYYASMLLVCKGSYFCSYKLI